MMSSACKPAPIAAERTSAASQFIARQRGGAVIFEGQREPPLGELMDDPITRRLMASDGVRMDHLLDLVAVARTKLVQQDRE